MNLEQAAEGLTHEDFKERLRASEPARRRVAQLIIGLGACELHIAPQEIAPTYEERGSYIDKGDIYARFRLGHGLHRFEVKHLSVDFSGIEDWPFGEAIFVDEKDGWERKSPKPKGYFSVNRALTVAVYLPCPWTAPCEWYVKSVWDKHYRTETDFYVASIHTCKAYPLPHS